jgi:inhibitor of KinA
MGIDEEMFCRVQAVSQACERQRVPGAIEQVPAFTTVTLYYDPLRTTFAEIAVQVRQLLAGVEATEPPQPRVMTIPVCYGGEFGSDLELVAEQARLTVGEVVQLHSQGDYRVQMLGFVPGFPYLSGMAARLATSRRASPRLSVPQGSVGIGGEQTGIYPLETPGGWQIIGRTPRRLFRPECQPPTLLRAGDRVRFRPITPEQFFAWQEDSR